jgi:hypothetical protein
VKNFVHQGGFSVVNVGDDGDVAKIHAYKSVCGKV